MGRIGDLGLVIGRLEGRGKPAAIQGEWRMRFMECGRPPRRR